MLSKLKSIFSIICWVAVIMWMIMIFSQSAKVASESSAQSGRLIRSVVSMLDRDFSELSPDAQDEAVGRLQHFVRKSAHFAEYFVLGALICIAVGNHINKRLFQLLISIFAGAAYAVSDEVHQFFVEGRSCQLSDMLLDSAGVAVGAAVVVLLCVIVLKLMRRKIKL